MAIEPGADPALGADIGGLAVLDGVAFRQRVWAVGATVLLAISGVSLAMSEISADRREAMIGEEIGRLAASLDHPHRDYLEPRMGLARQIISLLASDRPPGAADAQRIAAAALEHLPNVALLTYRSADGARSWSLEQGDPAGDLRAVERSLDASFHDNPKDVHARAADLAGWGRTLVLRFALPGWHDDDSVLTAIRLDPLYDDLFTGTLRARFAFQIYDETGLVWGEALEPPAGVRVVTRSFPVARQRWTVRGWPRASALAAERAREWWAITCVGLPIALLLAALLVWLLLWWGQLTQKILVAEHRTRLVVDQALDAVVSADAEGVITDWNAQAERIFGWSRQDAIGKTLAATIVPPQYRTAHAEGLRRFLATGEGPVVNRRIEITAWHHDAYEFPVELAISPIRVRGTYTFTAFVRDITERKRAEEELRRAKDAAEAANRTKSEFLATMSHEIRTPMNGIFGMTELALDTADDAERRDFLVRARACADSLMTIINDVLDFSKIEAGRLELECVEFDVRGVIDGVLDTLAIEAARKQIELVGCVDDALPPRLRGDPGRLRQIVMNLAGNALKFTEHGEIVIHVERIEPAAAPPPTGATGDEPATNDADAASTLILRCTVRDTGIGIAHDKQDAIFESFTQADNSMTRRYGGTGLGLAISQRLALIMGGTIGVESEPGHGSTFWFTARFAAASTAPAADDCAALASLRVLVVDDNATNRRFLLKTLQSWGCQPALASGGAEACDLLIHAARSGEPYDLVLLDMQMPDLDGIATAERIRAEPTTRDVPIIGLSSISRSTSERAAAAGFSALLPKPIKQAQLREVLVAAASTRVQRRQGQCTSAGEASRPARILVVDDNEANRIVADTVLKRAGYEVHLVTSGEGAIDAAHRLAPDLVLMDVQMPDIDGLAVTAAIRAREDPARQTPILALSAATCADDRARCLAAGMNGYVVKPLRRAELLAAVAAALAESPSWRAPAGAIPAAPDAGDEMALEPEVVNAITVRFLDEAASRCRALHDAAARGDASAVEHIGHYIRGGAAQLAIGAVCDLGAAVEALGRKGHLRSAVDVVTVLEEEIARARARVTSPAEGATPARRAQAASARS